MKGGSVFSGIGGLDLGFEQAGVESTWHIEVDKNANRILKARWPEVTNYGDITGIDPATLPAVDVLHGGFPCQDVSVAGRRAGLAGKRSSLFHEFIRLAAALRPRWVVVENVPGLLNSNDGRDMGTVLGELADLGYGWAYRVLDAQHFGVPQRRRRVFIVGCLGDGRAAAQVLFEPEGGGGDPPAGGEEGEGVAYALTGRSDGDGGARLETEGNYVVAQPLRASRRIAHSHGGEGNVVLHPLTRRHDSGEDGSGMGTPLVVNARQTPISGDKPGPLDARGDSHAVTVFEENTSKNEPASSAATREEMGNTMAEFTGVVRRLTPRECERLQGFPDGWTCLCGAQGDTLTCTCPDSPRYRVLGNAVCVPVARWVGERIVAQSALLETETR